MDDINIPDELDNLLDQASSYLTEGIHLKPLIEVLSNEIPLLSKLNLYKILPVLSGLLVAPNFHANTERIELIIHLLCLVSKGKKKANRKYILRLLNEYAEKCNLHRMEDPNEDVFVTNIIAHGGNYLLLEGLWDGNDFYTQESLDILNTFPQKPQVVQLFREVLSLLTISDLVVKKGRLSRYILGNGLPQQQIELPRSKVLKKIKNYVIFSNQELKDAQINYNNLRPFILNPDILDANNHIVGNSHLDKCPILEYKNKIIVALPTSIGIAIRVHIINWMKNNNKIEEFDDKLRQKQCDAVFNRTMQALSTQNINYKFPNITKRSFPKFDQKVYSFDKDKYAHIVTMHDESEQFLNEGVQSFKKYSRSELDRFSKYLQKIPNSISKQPNFNGGITIIIVGGLGRGMALPISSFPDTWYLANYKLSDFVNLGWETELSLLDLWKLYRYKSTLNKENINIFNISGDFNLYAYWKSQGYDLLPSDFPYKQGGGTITISSDFCQELRYALRNGYDSHAVYKEFPKSWMPTKRLHVSGFFKEIENLPIYVDSEVTSNNDFNGVVETDYITIWVTTNANIKNSL